MKLMLTLPFFLLLMAACTKENDMIDLIPQDDKYAQDLLNPQWDLVEKHFGAPVPEKLREFYSDTNKVLQVSFDLVTTAEFYGENRVHVSTFETIDENSTKHFEGYEKYLELASDGGEGIYFIDPTEENPEVFFYVMDDGKDMRSTELRLLDFLTAPRLKPLDVDD